MAATMSSVSLRAASVAPAASSSTSARCPARCPAKLSSSFTQTDRAVFMGSSQGLRAASKGISMQRPRRDVTTCAAKVVGFIKLAITAGKANPAPPIGPALGAKGVNIMAFCKEYNAKTADKAGEVIPVEITVFEDKSFTFILKTPPASELLKKAAGVAKGCAKGQGEIVGSISTAQLKEIAEIKMPDLNANDVEAAMKIVGGTARNMGITIDA